MQNSYVYSTTKQELNDVKAEVEAVRSLNFPCEFASTVGLPFETCGSVCFKNQAQFNPAKYVLGLYNSIKNSAHVLQILLLLIFVRILMIDMCVLPLLLLFNILLIIMIFLVIK